MYCVLLLTNLGDNNRGQTPERKLLVAILQRAFLDYFSTQKADRQAATEWLFDTVDSESQFSFNWVCDQLDIEANSVLARLEKLKKSRNKNSSRLPLWGVQRVVAN